ncbi:hypothetical protein V6259_13415 [Marinomonas sp. TI.3.20]|uniref:hypothetical protein n=1 Tax=Marinomonas sp. TI.3.20 TaxID=3121296 RepID=UPI00311E71FC
MKQHTIFVANVSDAAAYYGAVFGLVVESEEGHLDGQVRLSSKRSENLNAQLVLVEHEKAPEASLSNKSAQTIEWYSSQFWEDYHNFSAFGVVFETLPKDQNNQNHVIFFDAYGVQWALK